VLEVRALTCGYGDLVVVRDVSLAVQQGEVLAILGANGAGKTSTLMAIAGHVAVKSGAIRFADEDITHLTPMARCARGIAVTPEGRRLFTDLTVRENLLVGGYLHPLSQAKQSMDKVLDLFPRLKERLHNRAGALSGGEQQMVSIGRAMMAEPKVLLIDEVSLGLMPKNIDICYEALDTLRKSGLTIVLVEQSLERVLSIADWVCVLDSSVAAWNGNAAEARNNPKILDAYMGGAHQ
jgi:branched-chain amino acid transport system ATP-binding protein